MEKYIKPELEIIEFESEDVITTSGNRNDDLIQFPFIPIEDIK